MRQEPEVTRPGAAHTRRVAFSISFVIWLAGCEETPASPSVSGRVVPKEEVIAAFSAQLSISVPSPAVVRRAGGGWTSVAWIDGVGYRVYVQAPGIGISTATTLRPLRPPVGVFRVVTVAIDSGNTNIASVWPSAWTVEQQRKNREIIDYSSSLGLDPIAQFENLANLLVTGGVIPNPRSRDEVVSYLAAQGIVEGDWDIVLVISPGPAEEGGFGGGDFAYMGCFWGDCSDVDMNELDAQSLSRFGVIANALYEHEVGHIWGWEHEWSVSQPFEGLITDPALFGWTDEDGDGIVEILDPTPYGRK